jgi:hypothetical protein
MKLEVTTFRPREVIKHVLRTAAPASLKKELTLEGCIGDDVPLEVLIVNNLSFLVFLSTMLSLCTQLLIYLQMRFSFLANENEVSVCKI